MKKFPSIQPDKNNDDTLIAINTISNNGSNENACKVQRMKNVIELPDVWKRTNSYISNKGSLKSTTIKDAYKLSFDFSSSNQRNNNNNSDPQISLVNVNQSDNKAKIFAGLEFGISPLTDPQTTKFLQTPNNPSNLSKLGFHWNRKDQNLFDVGVIGGFECWDGDKPNI